MIGDEWAGHDEARNSSRRLLPRNYTLVLFIFFYFFVLSRGI